MAQPKRRQSNFEALNRFATHADRRADIKKQEMIKEKAKEARENATRARAASAGGFKQVLYKFYGVFFKYFCHFNFKL
jgi:predicted Holliday junction resolvase-like endonuclease